MMQNAHVSMGVDLINIRLYEKCEKLLILCDIDKIHVGQLFQLSMDFFVDEADYLVARSPM